MTRKLSQRTSPRLWNALAPEQLLLLSILDRGGLKHLINAELDRRAARRSRPVFTRLPTSSLQPAA